MRLSHGYLFVEPTGKDREIRWRWKAPGLTAAYDEISHPCMTLDALSQHIRQAWDCVNGNCQSESWDEARKVVDELRRMLSDELLPSHGYLARLGENGDTLQVCVDPSWIPVEILDAGGVPFSARYRLLCHKVLRGHAEDIGSLQSDESLPPPGACAAFAWSNLLGDVALKKGHWERMFEALARLFGACRVTQVADSNATALCVRDLLKTRSDCLYFFGHGEVRGDLHGLLCADDIFLSVRSIFEAMTPLLSKPAGFAFLNACHSASGGKTGVCDMAEALIAVGYQSVLGTVLPPLDIQASRMSERFFDSLVGNHCNLPSTLHQIHLESWEHYVKSDWAGDLDWACYRLYAEVDQAFLRTAITETDGRVLIRCEDGDIPYVKSGEVMSSGFADLLSTVCEHPPRHMCRTDAISLILNGDSSRSELIEFFGELVKDDPFILRTIATSRLNEMLRTVSEMTGMGNRLTHALHTLLLVPEIPIGSGPFVLRIDEDPRMIEVLLEARISTPLGERTDTWHFIDAAVDKAPEIIIDPVGLFRANGSCVDKSVEQILMVARRLADSEGEHEIGESHLLEAALTLLAAWPSSKSEDEDHLAKILDMSSPIDWRKMLASSAIPHLCRAKLQSARAEQIGGSHPLWWHLLASLCTNASPFVDALDRAHLHTRRIWDVVTLLILESHASRILPAISRTGTPVSCFKRSLPEMLRDSWAQTLRDIAYLLTQNEQILVVVPWRSEKTLFHDAFCSTAMGFIQLELPSAVSGDHGSRIWMHLPAQDLLPRHWGVPKDFGWIRHLAPHSPKSILREARTRALLCLHDMKTWIGPDQGVRPCADRVLASMKRDEIPALLFAQTGMNGIPELERTGLRVVHIDPIPDDDLLAFLREWDHPGSSLDRDEEKEAALDFIARLAMERAREDRIDSSVDMHQMARDYASTTRPAGLSPRCVEFVHEQYFRR